MTLSLLAYPPTLAFARNNVFVRLQTDNYISVAGVLASATINVLQSPYPSADQKFTIVWTSDIDHSVTFTFKDTPDNSGLQLPTGAGAIDLYQYTAAVSSWLQKNHEFYRDFIIQWNNDDLIYITARDKNITDFDFTDVSSPRTTFSNIVDGTLKELRPNFKILLEIYQRSSAGVDTFIGLKSGAPDDDGNVLFDVSNQIRPLLSPTPSWPQSSIIQERTDFLNQFYCRAAEYYGSDPVTYAMTNYGCFRAIYGGAGKRKIGSLNSQGLTFFDEHVVTRQRFLTFQPLVKTVDIYQPEKYFWYNYGNSGGTIKTKITAIYSDSYTYSFIDSYSSTLGKIYELNFTFDKLHNNYNWPIVTNHTIIGFKFQILNSTDTPISEERIIMLDNIPYQDNRYFMFLNSPGGYDTLRCIGPAEKYGDYDRGVIIKLLSYNFTQSSPNVVDNEILEAQRYIVNTGWLSLSGVSGKFMADYLRELFLSPAIYQFTTDGIERIKILSGDVLLHKSNTNLYALTFEYYKSFKDNLFSPSADDSMNADNAFFGPGWGPGFINNINTQILNNS